METRPQRKCSHAGRIIRHLLLVALVVVVSYVAFDGAWESRAIYVCDAIVPEAEFDEMGSTTTLRECTSLADTSSCVGLYDVDGNPSTCVMSSCGYKLLPHVDVSVAGSYDPLDPNAGASPTSFLSIMSIFYGIVPYIGVLYLASFLATGNISYLTRLFVWGMIATLNEVIFKRIFDQRRPSGSCLYFESYGMPSGHAATSMGLLTYILLELFVYHPNVLCGLTCQSRRRRRTRDEEAGTTTTTASSSSRIDYSFVWGYGWYVPSSGRGDANDPAGGGNGDGDNDDGADDIARSDSVFVHIRDVDANIAEGVDGGGGTIQGRGKWVHHIYALCYALLLLPVPFSRVYLHDHTRDQVLAGSALGVSISIIWYICFVRTFGGKLLTRWGKSDCGRWWGLKLGTV